MEPNPTKGLQEFFEYFFRKKDRKNSNGKNKKNQQLLVRNDVRSRGDFMRNGCGGQNWSHLLGWVEVGEARTRPEKGKTQRVTQMSSFV
jgi:hypothetical protein